MYCFCSQIHSLLELESVIVATAPLTYSLCIQHTTLRLCFSLQFFWCPTSLNASLLHSSLNIVATCETLVKMGTEQREETKKYWRWKDDAPEAGPFATLVPPPAHPCTQPPPPPPPSQCTRAITSSPWKRYYLALAPPLVESWGRHVLIRLLHSLLCTVLLLLLEKRTRSKRGGRCSSASDGSEFRRRFCNARLLGEYKLSSEAGSDKLLIPEAAGAFLGLGYWRRWTSTGSASTRWCWCALCQGATPASH